jgi:ABC-type dipeptide/oligopeptide/nickel transport system permease subunit
MSRRPLYFWILLALLVMLPAALWLCGKFALDPFTISPDHGFEQPTREAILGRDQLGRDLLARLTLGTGTSIVAATTALAVALTLALITGIVAGMSEGTWPDALLGFLKSLLFTVPFFLIAVSIAAVMQPGLFGIYVIVGAVMWAPAASLVRSETIRVRASRSVTVARAYGMSSSFIFLRYILPQCIVPPAIALLFLLPELLGLDVGLSFFGLGATPPNPSLGRLVFDGTVSFSSAWWLLVWPTTVLAGVCLSVYAVASRLSRL